METVSELVRRTLPGANLTSARAVPVSEIPPATVYLAFLCGAIGATHFDNLDEMCG